MTTIILKDYETVLSQISKEFDFQYEPSIVIQGKFQHGSF